MTSASPSPTPEAILEQYAQGKRDFSDLVLNECTLAGAQIPNIILRRASLSIVNLSTANLSRSQLQHATLNVSRLSGANLSQAQFQHAQLNVANLIRAILVGANLSDASLIRAELLRADLSNANLTKANLQEADLREARLRWTRLKGANLSQCDLRNSSLLGANLDGAQLYAANLEAATLRGAVLQRAELRHANLTGADLSGANLRGANLRWADLSKANLQEADLTDAKLSGANLQQARLTGATLDNATLVHADLNQAQLQQVHCVGTDISGANLTGALLHGAICYDVRTAETSCDWVDLSPSGDGSQSRIFSAAAEIEAFFNHRPPQVQVVADVALTPGANAALADAYAAIAEALSWFVRPPNVEITHRRTTLTFISQTETALMAIAYLATWPFKDGKAVRGILTDLLSHNSDSNHLHSHHRETLTLLEESLTLSDDALLKALRVQFDTQAFFAAPVQVKLINTTGQGLELYHNPRFGIRNIPPAEGIFPVQPRHDPPPKLAECLAFIRDPQDA
ncbi:MAG: pentapeptide repeat-containing protein [Leptolyngbyaceae cyanobacterium T60_A2020_046]|nr:pentapeptide repeat-containing protein [Leptolyngbyaceae cyanobacterium T60_A2020_046]